jgi:serine/threonine protein phosphatase PrpC
LKSVIKLFENDENMKMLIRCLQFGNAEINRRKLIPSEIVDLLLMCCSCLCNILRSSNKLSQVFRNNEGITTVLYLLQNKILNQAFFSNFLFIIVSTKVETQMPSHLSPTMN